MADVVFVTEKGNGSLVGFSAIRRLEPVSTIGGAPLYGSGLGACRPESRGAFGALVRAVIHYAKDRGAGLDIQTQSHNFPAVRLYEPTGFDTCASSTRSTRGSATDRDTSHGGSVRPVLVCSGGPSGPRQFSDLFEVVAVYLRSNPCG